MDENKKRALSAALAQIEKQFGKGSVMRMGDKAVEPAEVIGTGSLMLDIALGIGGLPKGRVVEIYGPESSGKTTLTLQTIAQCQKAGGTAAFVDAEHALDPIYAQKLGVNIDDLLVSQPDTGEQALEIADMLVRSNAVDMVVIDSVAALTPKAEIEGEMGDQLPGLQARLMSQALRKLTGNIKRSNCMVIFINQLRMKIGVMMPGQSPEATTGGNALKFYASVRLDIRRIGSVKKGDEIIGNETQDQGRQEQDGAAVQAGHHRDPLRRRHQPRRRADRDGRRRQARREVGRLVQLRTASASARARKTPASSSRKIRRWPTAWKRSCARSSRRHRMHRAMRRRPRKTDPSSSAAGYGMAQRGGRSGLGRRARRADDASSAVDDAPTRKPRRTRPEPTPTQRALGLLVRREHSRVELTRKLTARGVERDDAVAAVDKLEAAGLAERRALRRTSWSAAARPPATARSRIRAELGMHGLGREAVAAAMEAARWIGRRSRATSSRRRFGDGPRQRPRASAQGRRLAPASRLRPARTCAPSRASIPRLIQALRMSPMRRRRSGEPGRADACGHCSGTA